MLVQLNITSTDLIIDCYGYEPNFRIIQISVESKIFRARIAENFYLGVRFDDVERFVSYLFFYFAWEKEDNETYKNNSLFLSPPSPLRFFLLLLFCFLNHS